MRRIFQLSLAGTPKLSPVRMVSLLVLFLVLDLPYLHGSEADSNGMDNKAEATKAKKQAENKRRLMRILENYDEYKGDLMKQLTLNSAICELGRLKAEEALPLLVSLLGKDLPPAPYPPGADCMTYVALTGLDANYSVERAIIRIGDKAIPYLLDAAKGRLDFPREKSSIVASVLERLMGAKKAIEATEKAIEEARTKKERTRLTEFRKRLPAPPRKGADNPASLP